VIYVLSGQDDYSISLALERIKAETGEGSALDAGITSLESQVSIEEFRTACETMPFMTGKRLVVVNGLLGRFESQGKSRRSGRNSGAARPDSKQEEIQAFSTCMTGMPETTVLVLVEGVLSSANPLLKEISGKATHKPFPLPRDAKLREWIQKQVKEEGGSISTGAVQLLARLVGSNLWVMASEVTKLVLYTGGREITEDDVQAVVGYNQQATVFNMVDAILEFKSNRAEQLLQLLFRSGVAPVYLLFMLSRQVQLIIRAKELTRKRHTNIEIQSRLGMSSEWVLKKTMEQASRYSLPRLKSIYKELLDTDISIKTGKLDAELALNILVADLCRQGGAVAAGRRTGDVR
jgi:DNA polymerase-3 subunit delta